MDMEGVAKKDTLLTNIWLQPQSWPRDHPGDLGGAVKLLDSISVKRGRIVVEAAGREAMDNPNRWKRRPLLIWTRDQSSLTRVSAFKN